MANTNSTLSLLELDFETNKEAFKTFLKTQNQFKDYDFEGSNLSVLLDILAYNTYKNTFYYNMAISEAFLDSAQLRASVVSHAKELNYLPRSYKSSKAQIRVTFQATGESAPYVIAKGSPFTALVKNQSFTFTLPETRVVTSGNTTFTFDAYVYEGIYLQDSFIVNSTDEFPRYRISNKNVDTSSITVVVYEDGDELGVTYKFTDTLLGLTTDSTVYFLQAVEDGWYEIMFGDNFFGKKPKVGSTIVVDYRVASGSIANGSKTFSCDFDPTSADELTDTPVVTTIDIAADGLEPQDIESIRLYAPRYFATQQRAVSSDDYASLILSKFAGTIDDVTVYGGETVEPRKYGRVIVAVKPVISTIAPDFIKEEILTYLLDRDSIPTRVEITDPDYFYIGVESEIQYNFSLTDKTTTEIRGIVENAIDTFSTENLEKFGNDFRYSRFVRSLDDSDPAIVSNDTEVHIIKRLFPKTYAYNTFEIAFGNQLHQGRISTEEVRVVRSSYFTWLSDDGVEYPLSQIRDDGEGTLEIFTLINGTEVVIKDNIGSVNYTNGLVTISKLLLSAYDSYISVIAQPLKKDIIMNQNKIVFIDAADVSVSVTPQVQ